MTPHPWTGKLRALLRRNPPYVPDQYWEGRASELIETYDHPETWAQKGWMREGAEESVVPRLLRDADVASVLVVGAGSGRQYGFLAPEGFALTGFDIAPSLVEICRTRYPSVDTAVDTVVGAELRREPSDAVLASAVLQHVPPDDIAAAGQAVRTLARRLIVLREISRLDTPSTYIFVHDYDALLPGWRLVHREVTDEGPTYAVTLSAWAAP